MKQIFYRKKLVKTVSKADVLRNGFQNVNHITLEINRLHLRLKV
jgi:hypothetical protein